MEPALQYSDHGFWQQWLQDKTHQEWVSGHLSRWKAKKHQVLVVQPANMTGVIYIPWPTSMDSPAQWTDYSQPMPTISWWYYPTNLTLASTEESSTHFLGCQWKCHQSQPPRHWLNTSQNQLSWPPLSPVPKSTKTNHIQPREFYHWYMPRLPRIHKCNDSSQHTPLWDAHTTNQQSPCTLAGFW